MQRVEATFQRMHEIPLSDAAAAGLVAMATALWLMDFAILLCCFGAVHAPIPWSGVLLAFGVSQIVASLPVVPGGLGIVEGSLAVILVAYGAKKIPALAVVLVYRLLTFWLVIIVGWISIGVIEWRVRHVAERLPSQPAGRDAPRNSEALALFATTPPFPQIGWSHARGELPA